MTNQMTVKELLVEAKDAAELMVDLAYAAVFFDDDGLAQEVLRLEERVDDLLVRLRTVSMLASRTREDAERLAGVLSVAVSMEAIADAAEDIARVVLKDLGVPQQLRDDLRHATEVTARVRVRDTGELAGRCLRELELPARTGMWVIALRRDVDWRYGPDADDRVLAGDVLFLQGPPDGVGLVRQLAGGAPRELAHVPATTTLSHLDRAVDLVVELKDVSEVAVNLAYSAILLQDDALAAEVGAIESTSDDLFHRLEGWVLRSAAELEDPDELRGLLHLASASERIVDAARAMCRLVEVGGTPHPILAAALSETDEVVGEAVVAPGSAMDGRTVGELRLHVEVGMELLAVQRKERWLHRPRRTQVLRDGDRLLAIGPAEGTDRLRALAGDDRGRLEASDD
jgi:uncharacterized protein with PhoU and TrkA domain